LHQVWREAPDDGDGELEDQVGGQDVSERPASRLTPDDVEDQAERMRPVTRISLRPHDPSTGEEVEKDEVVNSYSPAAWQSARYSRRGFWKISAAGAKPISPQAKFVHSAAERGPKRWQLIKLVRNRTKALGEFPIWINNYNRLALYA